MEVLLFHFLAQEAHPAWDQSEITAWNSKICGPETETQHLWGHYISITAVEIAQHLKIFEGD